MSDDPKQNPRKLRLSRDVNPDTGKKDPRSASDAPQDSSPAVNMKPLRTGPPPPPPPDPSPYQDTVSESTESKEGQGGESGHIELQALGGDSSAKPPPESSDAPTQKSKLKLSHDPDNGRGVSEGLGSPQSATQVGVTPEPEVQATSPANGQGSSLPVAETKSHSILPSLLIVGLLFLLLGAAGFGLWKILFHAEESSMGQPTTISSDQEDRVNLQAAGPKNPIERAKQTIAEVPQLDMDQLTGDTEPNPPTAQTEPARQTEPLRQVEPPSRAQQPDATIPSPKPASQATIAPERGAAAGRANPRIVPPDPTAEVEATKATVSRFLASLHIGGMRQGARPMVLINGRAHNVGDTVQAETGLKFSGIRDGKLAFVDSNDIVYLKSF